MLICVKSGSLPIACTYKRDGNEYYQTSEKLKVENKGDVLVFYVCDKYGNGERIISTHMSKVNWIEETVCVREGSVC